MNMLNLKAFRMWQVFFNTKDEPNRKQTFHLELPVEADALARTKEFIRSWFGIEPNKVEFNNIGLMVRCS